MEILKILFIIVFFTIVEDPVDGSEADCHTCAVHETCAHENIKG